MKQEISVYDFERAFKDMNRDYYSYEGYKALFDYYDEIEGFELDVIAICCEVSEYDKEELLNDYKYLLDSDDHKEYYGEDWEEYYTHDLVKELQNHTTVVTLDNGSYLVWSF